MKTSLSSAQSQSNFTDKDKPMPTNDHHTQYRRIRAGIQPPGVLTRLFAIVAAGGLAVLTFMFSLVIFSIVLAVGLIGGLYLWWKTREVRKQMRAAAEAAAAGIDAYPPGFEGQPRRPSRARCEHVVIEGDFIREVPEQQPGDHKH